MPTVTGAAREAAGFGLAFLLAVACCGCGNISDKALQANFVRHEAIFEELRNMIVADAPITMVRRHLIRAGNVTIYSPPQDLERVGLSAKRYARYIQLFDQLGLAEGVSRSDYNVWFAAESPSMLSGGVTKGYIYSLSEKTPLVPELDAYVPAPTAGARRPGFLVFKQLKPNWYIYRDSI
jgi:hypothetical protein